MQRNVKMLNIVSAVFVILVCCLPINVSAVSLEVTGYSTLLGTYTDAKDDNTYSHEYADKYLNFTHQSRAGIQFNSLIKEDFEFHLTLLMEGATNYQVHADWFYLTYKTNEDLNFRFGRLKVPFYMVSNYIDIGHAYPWVTPPQEVYSTNLIHSADGIEMVYETVTSGGTNYMLEVYVGSSKNEDILSPAVIEETPPNPLVQGFSKGDTVFFDADNIFGFEALVATDSVTFRVGYYQAIIDAAAFNITGEETTNASVGMIIDWKGLLLYSEYVSRTSSEQAEVLFADQKASYVTLGYRFGHFLPYTTIAKIDGAKDNKYSLRQTSTGFGMRYEVNESTDIKFEAINVRPTREAGDVGQYGLFDNAATEKSSNVYAIAIDVLF